LGSHGKPFAHGCCFDWADLVYACDQYFLA
jgi:hypothetical protein